MEINATDSTLPSLQHIRPHEVPVVHRKIVAGQNCWMTSRCGMGRPPNAAGIMYVVVTAQA
jgi:hypothetical protein